MVIENRDGFIREGFGYLMNNSFPCFDWEISKFLYSNKETYSGSFYLLTVVIESPDVPVYEILERKGTGFLIFILHKLWNSTILLCMVGIRTSPRLFRKKMRKPFFRRSLLCKYLRYNLYITLDQIHIGIMNIGMRKCDIEDM